MDPLSTTNETNSARHRWRFYSAVTVVAMTAIAELCWLGCRLRGPVNVVARLDVATTTADPHSQLTSSNYCALNVPLIDVLTNLNTTPYNVLDEGLIPKLNVNVSVEWSGWRRKSYSYVEADPIMLAVLQLCEEKLGFTLGHLAIPATTYALRRHPRNPLRFEPDSSIPSGCIGDSGWIYRDMDMNYLTTLISQRLQGIPVKDETGLRKGGGVRLVFTSKDPVQVFDQLEIMGLALVPVVRTQEYLVYQPVSTDPAGNILREEIADPSVTITPPADFEPRPAGTSAVKASPGPVLRWLYQFPEGQRVIIDNAGLPGGAYELGYDARKRLLRDQIRYGAQAPAWQPVVRAYERYFHVMFHQEKRIVNTYRLRCPDPTRVNMQKTMHRGGCIMSPTEWKVNGEPIFTLVSNLKHAYPDELRFLQDKTGLEGNWSFTLPVVLGDLGATSRNLDALGLALEVMQEESWVWVINPAEN